MNQTLKLIEKHEGYRQNIYSDSKENRTIGIGLNLENGITQEEAELLAIYRINKIRESLQYKIRAFNSLSANRQNVLIDIAYNIGVHGLMKFSKMLAAIDEGNFHQAKIELLDSDVARELHNRYNELAKMLLVG